MTKREWPVRDSAQAATGRFRSGFNDVSKRHDDYLSIAIADNPIRAMLEDEHRRCCEFLAALESKVLDRNNGKIKIYKQRIAYLDRLLLVEVDDIGMPTNQRGRVKALRERAVHVFADEAAADRWMRKSCKALGDRRPVDVGKTADGFEDVSRILGRIELGVFS